MRTSTPYLTWSNPAEPPTILTAPVFAIFDCERGTFTPYTRNRRIAGEYLTHNDAIADTRFNRGY